LEQVVYLEEAQEEQGQPLAETGMETTIPEITILEMVEETLEGLTLAQGQVPDRDQEKAQETDPAKEEGKGTYPDPAATRLPPGC